jgi:Arc/MetJ family transcription regulator
VRIYTYGKETIMATNLAIDNDLLTEAQKIAGFKTKKETVNSALKEFIARRKQIEIIDLFGNIDYDEGYDYKAGRNRK